MGKGTQDKIISVRRFADQIGVSEGAVRKAIKNWNFTIGVQESGKIDSVAAMGDPWVKRQQAVKPKAGVSRIKAIEKIEEKIKEVADQSGEDDFNDVDLEGEDIASLIKVRTDLKAPEAMRRREILALAMDKKKLQELEGILVRREAVDKSLFLLGSQLKKALLDIPARCVMNIMAAKTEVEGIKVLTDELVSVLNTYASIKVDIK